MNKIFLICFVFFPSLGLLAESLSEPLVQVWRYATGGSISHFPAQGPGGDLYIIADDRALHSIAAQTGEKLWIYRPGGRLKNFLMVAPDGTIYLENERNELFAVTPGGTGRWKLTINRSSATLPAAAQDGRIFLPLTGGEIVGISRKGKILWTRRESAEAASSPVVSVDGIAWLSLTDGRILAIDGQGVLQKDLNPGVAMTSMALDVNGRLWAGSWGGRLFIIDTNKGEILQELTLGGERVISLITSPDGQGTVFFSDGTLVHLDSEGNVHSLQKRAAAGGAASAGMDGTLYFPAADGTLRVLNVQGEEQILSGQGILVEPLLTDQGLLVVGGGDWILYAWQAIPPGLGWRQFRGGPGRTGGYPTAPIVLDREAARLDAGFYIRERTARSGEAGERLELVRELASFPTDANLRKAMPWAPLLLEDLASGGTLRQLEGGSDLPYDNAAQVRVEAYALIARGEDFRVRRFLIDCLQQETDFHAMAAGFRALGEIGSDGDGSSIRMMAAGYQRLASKGGAFLALETARALKDLIRYNGTVSDPAGFALINTLLTAPLNSTAREEILDIMRLMSGLR